jgi:hypothetical protein
MSSWAAAAPPAAYGAPPANYGTPPPPPGYGAPPPGAPAGYGAPPANYGAPPTGAPPQGFWAPPPAGYGAPLVNYGAPSQPSPPPIYGAPPLTREDSVSDDALYWEYIDSNGFLKVPQSVSPEIRKRIELIHLNELKASRIVWTGDLKKDFQLHISNTHPIISMFKCDILHCFTRKQRRANFLFVTMYSLFLTMVFADLSNTLILDSSKCSNTTLANVTVCEANCSNTPPASIVACEAALVDRYGNDTLSRALVETVISFVFIKFPRSIWSAIAEKLAICRCGFIISYTVMFAGIVVFSVFSAVYASVNSHTRNAFIGYVFVLLTDYEPFSTFLLFGWYHRKIMLSGHFGHWQGCIFGHICDSAMDRRVQVLRHATRSISLPDSVVTV